MKVNIHNQTDLDVKTHIQIIKKIFKSIPSKQNIHIIFVTPEEIQRLNMTYRQMDKTTDVLSFINDDPSDQSLGDIFINLTQAEQQAISYGHTMKREVGFLSVHGYLHLLGYDHHTDEDERLMIQEQERILENAKLKRGI
jgi:probable rRNA maturation factor